MLVRAVITRPAYRSLAPGRPQKAKQNAQRVSRYSEVVDGSLSSGAVQWPVGEGHERGQKQVVASRLYQLFFFFHAPLKDILISVAF